jgi:DNA (cytosine-5)-methyltransferase 1
MWPTPNAMDGTRPVETPEHWAERQRQKKAQNPNLGGLHRPLTVAILETPPTTDSNQLTLFAEVFPVSRIRSLVDAAALPTSAISGRNSCESFAELDPDGSWRKTCQGYSQVTLDGSLERFSETWPRAGMTRNGTAYRLPPLAPITDAIESGSWPTPQAQMPGAGASAPKVQNLLTGNRHSFYLTQAVEAERQKPGIITRRYPTPAASEGFNRRKALPAKGRNDGLETAAKYWPTPTAQDASNNAGSSQYDRNSLPLNAAIGGALNPTWVEWLMGYPLEWTACAAWGTRSSRKSPSGSRAGSSRSSG